MYDAYLSFAEELADASGAEVLKYFRRPLDVEAKADTSPVTIADRQSEKVMRGLIEKRFPAHGIVGEEFGK
ncbi:MAG TPA: histidinol phosphate phosphatase, partial [Alphaproteobacteria bacterium]|nr:histidinol phosphate phosphatase [Alphaproteobacteria bacterium]